MMNYELLTPAVERAAGIAISNFPAHHTLSDVKQEMWVWILENKNTVTRVLESTEFPEMVLEPLLVRAANSFLKKEDAQTYGYDEADRFFYSLDLIKSILEVVFDHEDWQSFATALDAMPKGKSDHATAGNNLASYADVSRAVSELPENQYNAIVWKYKYHYTQRAIGEAMGVTTRQAQSLLDGAYSAIRKSLGEFSLSEIRSGYDGRTQDALTRGNIGRGESAQIIVDRDYDG
jgi:DNA-directed RNA polymerase specialized sigma24 family protein